MLRDHQSLGAHTDIIQFKRGNVTIFRWTHPVTRPLGFRIHDQCTKCNRLKTMKPKPSSDHSTILMRCTECKHEILYGLTPEPKWIWIHNSPNKGDERGAWIAFLETHEIRDQSN